MGGKKIWWVFKAFELISQQSCLQYHEGYICKVCLFYSLLISVSNYLSFKFFSSFKWKTFFSNWPANKWNASMFPVLSHYFQSFCSLLHVTCQIYEVAVDVRVWDPYCEWKNQWMWKYFFGSSFFKMLKLDTELNKKCVAYKKLMYARF